MKSTRKSRKPDPQKAISSHLISLHQRFYQTLNLGFRYSEDKEKEWYTNDVAMQKFVIQAVSAFLADISPETLHNSPIKDSVADMVRVIGGILKSSNDNVLIMASQTVVKLVHMLPSSLLQPHVGHLSSPLSSLLSKNKSQVGIMSATALKLILSKLSVRKEDEMWEILRKHNVVAQIICNMQSFLDEVKPIEYFVEMALLLSSVMQVWPRTRYPVWSDTKLREVLEIVCRRPETSVSLAVLQLYSAIASCGYGAQKLMENGEPLMNSVLYCMSKSQPLSVRILAFKLAQHLMAGEELCLKALSFSCKPLVESIISTMSCSNIHRGKDSNENICLMVEACRLALITRWPGKHHGYLWKLGFPRSLLHVLMYDFLDKHPHDHSWSVEKLICVARDGLNANFFLGLRAHVWEIFGSLIAQCEEDFNPSKDENEFYIRILITSAWDSIGRERLLRLADREYTLRSISAAKAVLMMMYSPCEYIAFHTRLILSEVLRLEGWVYLKHLLKDFQFVNSEVTSMPDELQILINLMGLTCYSGLPEYYKYGVRNKGVQTLLGFVWWWFRNEAHIENTSRNSHLRDMTKVRMCCKMDMNDWEGREIHLVFALWSLAELINSHEAENCSIDIFAHQKVYGKELFIRDIQDICVRTSSSGLRWYASYILSLFGVFGFPSKLGIKTSSLFCENDYSDMYLVLRDGQCISVHRVILLLRCPSILPPDIPVIEENPNNFLEEQVFEDSHKSKKEVTLSAHVDEQVLLKVLEFVYSGCVHAQGEHVRMVKVLAKHCNIQPLLRLLNKKRPKWAASVPLFDLTKALGPAGCGFSDVILQAKSNGDTRWTSNCCSFSVPHIHSHKAILMSSCNYLRAIFQSGMQESRSQFIKVPIALEALHKLAIWVYSGDVPKPLVGCTWQNMDVGKKMHELQPFIELCWLAEFWFIDGLRNECSKIVADFMDSPELSLKLIQFAANLSQWEIVDLAANTIAPVYINLRISGGLDQLDESLIEIIRLACVRLSQN